jgi:hypothetical protein
MSMVVQVVKIGGIKMNRKFKRKIRNFFRIFHPKYIKNFLLCLKYPFLKIESQTYPWVNGYYITWLDEIPIGWRKRFGKELCDDIKNYISKHNIKNYHIRQMKEKWNCLEIYDNSDNEFYNEIHQKYQDLSEKTCVYCGKPATWVTTNGWYESVCDDCKKTQFIDKSTCFKKINDEYETK